MSLQILADEENWVLKARIHADTFTPSEPGEHAHSYPDITEHPPDHADSVWFNPETGAMTHPSETLNPHAYKVEQRRVFHWAHRNIHDLRYLAYGLHGHQQKAKIFHVFAVVNVMAALHVPNILGDNWRLVERNMVPWDEFTRRIRIADWTNALRFNYATFIETPVALFPRIGSDFRASMDGSGAIVIDPSLLAGVGDIIPINQ